MVIAMSGSSHALSKKTKSRYNIRQFYYEAQQNTYPFLLDRKTQLVHMEDLLQRKARMKALYKPLFIRLIYAVFNILPADIHCQNDLKVIRNIFRENLAVFVSGAPFP